MFEFPVTQCSYSRSFDLIAFDFFYHHYCFCSMWRHFGWIIYRAGKKTSFFKTKNRALEVFKGFFKRRTQNYDPQAKIRPCERHKSQFIFEYHLY